MTQRLYHADAYQRRFEATVVAHATHDGRPALALDATAFYPEAGGQLGDHGTLGGLAVIDTREDDAGQILHVVGSSELPPIGTRVTGELDWARRRQHMAQHTAQHLLSGALLDRAAAPTASARLGESALTIDVARDRIPDAEIAAAEDLANDLVDDDLAIRTWFPAPDELAALKLRRDPKVDADIRVVAIGDFDFSPCGGTHVARTSQLGALRVTGTERYKGMTRITFTAARRGRAELFARDQVLRALAATLSCGVLDVPAAVAKLRATAADGDAELTRARGRLAELIARELVAATPTGPVIAAVPGDAALLRTVAIRLTAAGRDALLCAPEPDGAHVVLQRTDGSVLDCGALWKQLVARVGGGRGGGKADRAEGRLAGAIADWPTLVSD
jgi:alanyl-tRNA synthetase